MAQFVDRRLNPRDKSLGNRSASFVGRAVRGQASGRQGGAPSARSPTSARADRSRSRSDGIDEPLFHLVRRQRRARVRPARQQGIRRRRRASTSPRKAGGGGGAGEGPRTGDGEDAFTFALTEDEFLDILFEDLELPDLVKTSLKDAKSQGVPARRLHAATARRPISPCCARCASAWAAGWRCAGRARSEVEKLEEELDALRANRRRRDGRATAHRAPRARDRAPQAPAARHPLHRSDRRALQPLHPVLGAARQGGDVLPDGRLGLDGRAREGSRQALLHPAAPVPEAASTSASTSSSSATPHEAKEVDEQEFFYGRETGGTVVSSALEGDDRDPRGALSDRRTGTSMRRRPPTATIPAATREQCVALLNDRRSCRSASITPISRSPTEDSSSHRRQRQGTVARLCRR